MGYLWNVALRAGKSVRNYGFFCDLSRYDEPPPDQIPLKRQPFDKKIQVAYPTKAGLMERTTSSEALTALSRIIGARSNGNGN